MTKEICITMTNCITWHHNMVSDELNLHVGEADDVLFPELFLLSLCKESNCQTIKQVS